MEIQKRATKKPQVSAQKKGPNLGHPRLAGRVALITGGNRGIGLAIARAFVGEGCSVLITGRDESALRAAKRELEAIRAAGAEVLAERCDVRDEKAVKAVFAKVKRHWGRLEILVNNAGIAPAFHEVVHTPTELWRSVIDTNLTGTFLCTREALPLMGRGATIVNVMSLTVKSNPPKFAAYNASKMGVLGFTETLRTDLVPTGIRVMALMPGATDTAIWEQFWPDAPREGMVRAEDVAAGVLYAVSLPPQASVNELLVIPQKGLL